MKKLLNKMLFVAMFLFVTMTNSQTISEVKTKDRSVGTNQLKKKPKKYL